MSDYVDVDTSREFELPVGLRKNGKAYKKGRIRLLTNKDILEISDDPDLQKYVDLKIEISDGNLNFAKFLKLAAVKTASAMITLPRIVKFDNLEEFTKEDVKNMFPADSRYLMELSDKLAEEGGESVGKSKGPLSSQTGSENTPTQSDS